MCSCAFRRLISFSPALAFAFLLGLPIALLSNAPTRLPNQAIVTGTLSVSAGVLPQDAQVALSYPFKDRDFCRESTAVEKSGTFSFSPVNGAADFLLVARANGYKTQVVVLDLSKGDVAVKIQLRKS